MNHFIPVSSQLSPIIGYACLIALYWLLSMRRLSIFLVALGGVVLLIHPFGAVSASSYDVTASIPYPAPTQPASVNGQLNGTTTSGQLFGISGTCQPTSPVSVVSIWRDSTLVGSVNCEANGTFVISVSLILGINNFIARTSSLSNLYGPDSTPFSVTYNPTLPASLDVASASVPANTNQPNVVNNTGLSIQTSNTVEILDDSNVVTVMVVVAGGTSPYTIMLNWGDGSTDSKVVDGPGTYAFKHKYEKQGIYKALATLTDVLGVTTTQEFLVSAKLPQLAATSGKDGNTNVSPPNSSDTKGLIVAVVATVGVLGVSTFFLTSFWLGQHFGATSAVHINKPSSKLHIKTRLRK